MNQPPARLLQLVLRVVVTMGLLGVLQPAVAGARPLLQQQIGQVSIKCQYFSPTDRQFTVSLESRSGGAPTGTATLRLVAGGEESQTFTGTNYAVRGPYVSLQVSVSWPDGATGFAEATCGQIQIDTIEGSKGFECWHKLPRILLLHTAFY